ncbi:MAG: hypothetical protein JNL19_13155 [Burkholderiales bacterium]|nr:hypothetical protein [Burkholderiales bacterium]
MTTLNAELFESLIGKQISVHADGGIESWQVDGVTRREAHAARPEQPFNVYLTAPASNNRRQGMRQGVTPDGASIDFFAVPIGATGNGVNYEVIFN